MRFIVAEDCFVMRESGHWIDSVVLTLFSLMRLSEVFSRHSTLVLHAHRTKIFPELPDFRGGPRCKFSILCSIAQSRTIRRIRKSNDPSYARIGSYT